MKVFVVAMLVLVHCFSVTTIPQISINPVVFPDFTPIIQQLDDRVIYIEADSPNRGKWMCSMPALFAKFGVGLQIRARDQLLESLPCKWRLVYLGDSKPGKQTIALESVENRNFYISNSNDISNFFILLKESGYPKETSSVNLYMKVLQVVAAGSLDENTLPVTLQVDKKEVRWIGIYKNAAPKVSKNVANWRFYIPEISDDYVPIQTVDNTEYNQPVEWTYSRTIGISKTNGQTITETMEETVSFEISSAFGSSSGSLTYAQSWEQQQSETFSKSVTSSVTTTIPPGAKVQIIQLTGYYGDDFKVQANDIKFRNVETSQTFKSMEELDLMLKPRLTSGILENP